MKSSIKKKQDNNLKRRAFLISPSGFIDKKNLDIAKKRLKKLGFSNIYYRRDIISKYLSYAGDYKRRIEEINNAYLSNADVLFVVRGGMGAIHILDSLHYSLIKESNKVLIGFSDITILLNSIYQITGSRCFHGMNIGTKDKLSEKTIRCFFDVLNKRSYKVRINKKNIFRDGETKAKIVGGNLELLGRSLGTEYEINTKNKILFLEDYDMKSWRVFDILWQLKLAGKFDSIKGVILGYFNKCGKDIGRYLREFFKDFECPVIINQPIGHREPNLTIPIGEYCIINTAERYWGIEFNDLD